MMKKVLATMVAGILVVGMAAAGEHPGQHGEEPREAKITQQTTCPVMGSKINRNLYVDHKGKRIYVCCKGCVGVVQKDPEKHVEKLEKAGVVLDAPPKPEKHEKSHGDHEGHNH